jgi:hypothetical protein
MIEALTFVTSDPEKAWQLGSSCAEQMSRRVWGQTKINGCCGKLQEPD